MCLSCWGLKRFVLEEKCTRLILVCVKRNIYSRPCKTERRAFIMPTNCWAHCLSAILGWFYFLYCYPVIDTMPYWSNDGPGEKQPTRRRSWYTDMRDSAFRYTRADEVTGLPSDILWSLNLSVDAVIRSYFVCFYKKTMPHNCDLVLSVMVILEPYWNEAKLLFIKKKYFLN